MDFGSALQALKQEMRVARSGWNGKGMWLSQVKAESWSHISATYETLPFIAMKTADHKYVPWLASQTDMLAEDWELV